MIRRFFARIVIGVLLAACGYQGWRAQQLEHQVAQLRAQLSAANHRVAQAEAAKTAAPAQGWLDKANRHIARAREAAGYGDFHTAQREWDRSVVDLQRAVSEPETKTRTTLTRMRQTVAVWQTQADALWKKAHPPGGGTP